MTCLWCDEPPGDVSARLCNECMTAALRACATGPDRQELWAYHPRYPRVEVSQLGRVRVDGRITHGGRTSKGNYQTVTLPGGTRRQVHHLVLETFVSDRPVGLLALHWDDDVDNNVLMNLRWDTAPANVRDAVRNGRRTEMWRTGQCSVEDCEAAAREPGADCWHHYREYRRDVARRALRLSADQLPVCVPQFQ